MKKYHVILLILFFCGLKMTAQENRPVKQTPPSDQPAGYTYDYDKAKKLIIDHLTNPNEFNKEAKVLVSSADFPFVKSGEQLTPAFYEKLRVWMEKHPDLIINALKNRKDIVTPY